MGLGAPKTVCQKTAATAGQTVRDEVCKNIGPGNSAAAGRVSARIRMEDLWDVNSSSQFRKWPGLEIQSSVETARSTGLDTSTSGEPYLSSDGES